MVTSCESIKKILVDYVVELGSLEDTYITSRCNAREYSFEEVP
jgi:hypothetical protein